MNNTLLRLEIPTGLSITDAAVGGSPEKSTGLPFLSVLPFAGQAEFFNNPHTHDLSIGPKKCKQVECLLSWLWLCLVEAAPSRANSASAQSPSLAVHNAFSTGVWMGWNYQVKAKMELGDAAKGHIIVKFSLACRKLVASAYLGGGPKNGVSNARTFTFSNRRSHGMYHLLDL